MHFEYSSYVFSYLLMFSVVKCGTVKNNTGITRNVSKENEKIRPNVSSRYCINKFSCDGNYTKSCYCDYLCEFMGDCCKGFKTNRTLERIPAKSQFSCYRMLKVSVDNTFGGLVVAACPTDWRDDESRSMCEDRRRKIVLSNTYMNNDGIVFKNLFCAYCNSVIPHEFNFRVLKICANESIDEKQKGEENCNGLYDKRAEIDSVRICPLKVIDKCSFDTTGDLSVNCSTGEYELVYDLLGNMYRNIYCGLCNEVSGDELSCEKDKVDVGDPYAFSKLLENEESQVDESKTDLTYGNVSDGSGGINATKTTDSNQENADMYVTVVALVISIVSLVITLVVYRCFPVLLNIPGKITFCLALSLLLAQFLFLVSSETERIPWLCITMAVLVHYFFLATFCWMNVIAFDLWMTFANHKFDCGDKRKFYYYNVYAWLVPVLIVTIAVALYFSDSAGSFNPHYGENGCWIFSENAKLLLFIGPLAFFKLFDIVAFSCTVFFIGKARREASFATAGNKNTCPFFINLKLSLIMGLTWTFAFLAKYSDNDVLWYMFTIFNTLQGFFIFVCFVCTKKVFNLVIRSRRRKRYTNTDMSNVNSSKETGSTSL